MTEPKVVFVFPAFASDYRNEESYPLPGFLSVLHGLIDDASLFVDPVLKEFHPLDNNFLDHELRNQYMAYIFGCAVSGYLKERNVIPDIFSGLSMGLYAALKESGALSFRNGLNLIRQAYLEIEEITREQEYTMGKVIGLNERDIMNLIELTDPSTQITNQMAEYSFVFSGRKPSVERVLQLAKEEGAFHTGILNTSKPYHSAFLEKTAARFEPFVRNLDIRQPPIPILSVIDQHTLHTKEHVISEIIRNLFRPFNWYKTQLRLQEMSISDFIECGPSKSLAKNARFIPGPGKFFAWNSYTG